MIVKEWGEPEDTFWIYSGSSPWHDKYEMVYNKKLSDSEYEVKIKFSGKLHQVHQNLPKIH